jgi:hypothetical protein
MLASIFPPARFVEFGEYKTEDKGVKYPVACKSVRKIRNSHEENPQNMIFF